MFRPTGSFRYAGKGPIVPVFVDVDECNVGVVGATLPVGFSIPVIDWFSLVCKDVVWWVIGMTLPKFINVNFWEVVKVRELFRNFSTSTLGPSRGSPYGSS